MNPLQPSLLLAAMCAVLCLLTAPKAAAQNASPPGKLTYQGFLTDAAGVPLGDTQVVNTTVIFRIYNQLSGGVLKWSEQQTVTVDKGHFSVLLGEGSPFGAEPNNPNLTSVFTGGDASDRFMEITVGTTTIAPRLQFQPAPYAMLASSARQIVDSTGTPILSAGANAMTFTGGVTATTLNATNVVTTTASISNVVASAATVTNLTTTTVAATTVTATTFVGNGTIPVGGIIMWSGANPPAGWALCTGQTVNGQLTPDLRNRFVVSSGTSYAIGATGGADSVLLANNQVPLRAHTHTVQELIDADEPPAGLTPATPADDAEPGGDDGARRYLVTRTTSSASLAATVPLDNRPAYYALAFIMRVQ